MLIRRGIMDGLDAYMLKSFEDRMVEHLNETFPEKTGEMGEEQVRAAIRGGIDKAEDYFVERECDVSRFIDLKFAIHMDFDEQQDMAWAREILDDVTISGKDKMDRVYAELPERRPDLQDDFLATD